jgi:hypothetical protein
MSQIIRGFGTIFVVILAFVLCLSVNKASAETAAAKEYKADVIAELENSDFNPVVMQACINQAQTNGYELEIKNCQYDENNMISCAQVVLTYTYKIPIIALEQTLQTRGIAR